MEKKIDVLKKRGTYNSRCDQVEAELFKSGGFFDPQDLLQVKYEMLRAVEIGSLSVTEAAKSYGFSRQGYYEVKEAFDRYGFMGLLPSKTGPKEGYKFTAECQLFVDSYIAERKTCSLEDVKEALYAKMGVRVSTQTITNYLKKRAADRQVIGCHGDNSSWHIFYGEEVLAISDYEEGRIKADRGELERLSSALGICVKDLDEHDTEGLDTLPAMARSQVRRAGSLYASEMFVL